MEEYDCGDHDELGSYLVLATVIRRAPRGGVFLDASTFADHLLLNTL
jgi:hypothetical protein